MADTYSQMINNASTSTGASVDTMLRVLNSENPNMNPAAVSRKGVKGLCQITQDTWATVWKNANPPVPYSTDPQLQITTMATLVSKYESTYGRDYNLIGAAYNAGASVASDAAKLMKNNPGMDSASAVLQAMQNQGTSANKINETQGYMVKMGGQPGTLSQIVDPAQQPGNYTVDNHDAATAQPVSGIAIPGSQIAGVMAAISPSLINSNGIFEKPWFQDRSLVLPVRNNAEIKNGAVVPQTQFSTYPVTFQLYFDTGNFLPFSINLAASLSTHQRSMRHASTRQRTRTGLLINLWGMVPDMITGQGSTGLFMNRLGATDFLSLTTVSPEVQQMVKAGYGFLENEACRVSSATTPQEYAFVNNLPAEACRVATRDAFMELLALFKNNGTVWFQNQQAQAGNPTLNQQSVDVWSPVTGSTSFQNVSRRNDVMVRGQVVMNFRNSSYYGYFKNLTWSLDAKNPYRWNFTFTFQVESTCTKLVVPNHVN